MYFKKHDSYSNIDFITEINQFIQEHYKEENIARGAAYLSDTKPARNSYGFNLNHSSNPGNTMPSINVDATEYPTIATLTDKLFDEMNVDKTSRVLFNIQKYFSNNEVVVKHFDGHYFNFTHDEAGNLVVLEGLRPKSVAVLTVLNDVVDGGTRVWKPESIDGEVIKCSPGDLLVFNNWECMHGADAFEAVSSRPDNLVRLTIGWRSIEDQCKYISGGMSKEVSISLAKELHRDWLVGWPKQWEKIKSENKQAAF